MTFSLKGSGSIGLSGSGGPLKININQSGESSDSGSLQRSQPAPKAGSGKSTTLSNVKSALDVSENAIQTISDLKQEQLALIDEAAASPTNSRTRTLDTAVRALQNEITRVVDSATYNGQAVLKNGGSYSVNLTGVDVNDAISSPDTSSLFNPSVYETDSAFTSSISSKAIFTSQSGAATLVDVLDENISKTDSLRVAIGAASNKADDLYANTPSVKIEPVQDVRKIEDAQDLVKKIADQISNPYNDEFTKQQIIDASSAALDSTRVNDLLQNP